MMVLRMIILRFKLCGDNNYCYYHEGNEINNDDGDYIFGFNGDMIIVMAMVMAMVMMVMMMILMIMVIMVDKQ